MELLFFVLGLALIGLGIYAKVHSKRMNQLGITRAVVTDCQPAVKRIGQKEIPCTQVTFEIATVHGVVNKTIMDNGKYSIGDTVELFYDYEKDYIEFPKNISPEGSKGPYLIIAFGAAISCLVAFLEIGKRSAAVNDALMTFLSYFSTFALIGSGIYLSVIKPMRRKRAMIHCRTVQGTQVDFIKEKHGSKRKGYRVVYKPIYEFVDRGEVVRIEGELGDSTSRFRQIGRVVTIVINDENGEKYCLEDMAGIRKVAGFITVVGVLVLVILFGGDGFGLFGGDGFGMLGGDGFGLFGGADNLSEKVVNISDRGSVIELKMHNGYSTEAVELSDDERYCEYYYMPAEKEKTYTYTIKIYEYGVGEVVIFPNESNGKGLNQTFSFYMEYEDLKPILNARKTYDFSELAGEVKKGEAADKSKNYEYLYSYDGKERIGSGGYGVYTEEFAKVAGDMKAAVPDVVWKAIEDEIARYYE